MIDRLDRILNSLTALHAEADALIDEYCEFVQRRDGLGGQPLPSLRQTHVDGRAGWALNLKRALELAKADLANERAPPANGPPSVPRLPFDPETTGITDNLTPREAARQMRRR
jgi:hypothetical protein